MKRALDLLSDHHPDEVVKQARLAAAAAPEVPGGLVEDLWLHVILPLLRAEGFTCRTSAMLRRTCRWFATHVAVPTLSDLLIECAALAASDDARLQAMLGWALPGCVLGPASAKLYLAIAVDAYQRTRSDDMLWRMARACPEGIFGHRHILHDRSLLDLMLATDNERLLAHLSDRLTPETMAERTASLLSFALKHRAARCFRALCAHAVPRIKIVAKALLAGDRGARVMARLKDEPAYARMLCDVAFKDYVVPPFTTTEVRARVVLLRRIAYAPSAAVATLSVPIV